VSELPDCDICKMEGRTEPAEYDGATSFGRWGYMCEPHFQTHGKGLGHGIGQRLVLESPEPAPRVSKADELCNRCGKGCPNSCWNKDTGRFRVLGNEMKTQLMIEARLYCEEV